MAPAILAVCLLAVASVPTARAAAADTAILAFARPVTATVDGVVGPGEYPATGTFRDNRTGMELFAVQNGENMTVAFTSPGTGWLSIGFGRPGVVMDGDNILMGYVAGGTTVLTDQFGLGLDHSVDEAIGGRDNILAAAGSESGGRTTLEVRFGLDTGDPYDFRMLPGRTYGLMFAYEETADDLTTMHTAASLALVFVEPDPNRIPTRRASLTLGLVGTAKEGSNGTLVARILGDDGLPYARAPLEFLLNSSVGVGLLGAVEANASGFASLNYTFVSYGEFRFLVRFLGDLDYLPTEASLPVVADRAPSAAEGISLGFVARFLAFTVLASVALVFLYCLGQVFLIRGIGRSGMAAESRKESRRE
jgi:hypothetical protein